MMGIYPGSEDASVPHQGVWVQLLALAPYFSILPVQCLGGSSGSGPRLPAAHVGAGVSSLGGRRSQLPAPVAQPQRCLQAFGK